MQIWLSNVWPWFVGLVPSTAIAVAAAYKVFKSLGEKWIDDRFARQLKDHQAALDAQLKAMQADIDRQLKQAQAAIDHGIHRAKRLYDKEFEVMQEAWAMANRCFEEGQHTAVDFHPQLSRLSDGDYAAFLKNDRLLSRPCKSPAARMIASNSV